ncbi:MAG: T9SS type A sorting domain-containing protein [Bacteroidota bacterium]
MKKIIFLLIIALISISSLLSNPIVLPQAIISELKFEENNKWLLEISFQFSTSYYKQQFDSICVVSSNGFSRIRLDNIKDGTSLFVITSDSLITPLSIKSEGDCVKLYSFLSVPYPGYHLIDSLHFGNYPGSIIDSLPMGYSITRLSWGIFVKDKNPTIGLPNDTIGTCGILKGHLYNKNDSLITKGNFILDNSITLYNDGTFSTNVYSRKVVFRQVQNHYQTTLGQNVGIDTLELNINPGCSQEKNIHFINDYIIDGVDKINQASDYGISIMNYPNPFNLSTNIVVTIPSSLTFAKKQIDIYNALGQKINSLPVSNRLIVQWNGKDHTGKVASTGIYYYRLVLDNRIHKSGSMILLK